MEELTAEGRRRLEEIAQRHGVSLDATTTLLRALALGNGTQAQFNHPDLGGMGQWSRGGMIMVGDMFNNGLKARVDSLCNELAGLLGDGGIYMQTRSGSQSQSQRRGGNGVSLFMSGSASGNQWWPAELGSPDATGAQNDLRYAWFSRARRLAIQRNGQVQVYDTGNHTIGGFSQQQSGDQSLTFTSQFGLVRVSELPLITGGDEPTHLPPAREAAQVTPSPDWSAPTPSPSLPERAVDVPPTRAQAAAVPPAASEDIFSKLEKLAELHQKGILTQEEFSAKKAELLARI